MLQRAKELRAQKGLKGAAKREREAKQCLEAIAALRPDERVIAERFHRIVTEEAPDLDSKTWYGFPSYAKDGKVLTFLQPGSKFETRYCTIGFQDSANLDDGAMWPTSFAILEMTPAAEATLRALVKKAAS